MEAPLLPRAHHEQLVKYRKTLRVILQVQRKNLDLIIIQCAFLIQPNVQIRFLYFINKLGLCFFFYINFIKINKFNKN